MSETVRAARRVAVQVQPEKFEEFTRTVRTEIIPRIIREKGFRRHFLIQSKTNSSEMVAFSLWDREEDIAAYVDSGHAAENLSRIRPYLIADPLVSVFKVLEHDVGTQFKGRPAKPPRPRPKAKRKRAKKKRRK